MCHPNTVHQIEARPSTKMKLKSIFTLVVVLGSALTLQLASAQGVVNFSNTNAVSISSQAVGDQQMNLFFTTGNNSGGYTFNSFALLLAANPNAAGVQTYANLDLTYGDILNAFSGNSANHVVSATEAYDVFTPDSVAAHTSFLAANTTYEIVFFWFGGNPLNISSTDSLPTSTDGWSYGGATFPFDSSYVFNGSPVFAITATPVTAAPEPSTLALAGLAGLAACWRSRKKPGRKARTM